MSVLLCAVMLFSVVPMSVFAAEAEEAAPQEEATPAAVTTETDELADTLGTELPDAPTEEEVAKITSSWFWIRQTGQTGLLRKFLKVIQLQKGTFTVGQPYLEKGSCYVDVTITNVELYIAAFEEAWPAPDGMAYVIDKDNKDTTYTGTFRLIRIGHTWFLDVRGGDLDDVLNGLNLWVKLVDLHTVTYTDGLGGTVFTDKTYTVREGDATPEFGETPTREGYTFYGWQPEVAETVTGNVTYTAVWAPAKPNDKNIIGGLVEVICDTDESHTPVMANWKVGSGDVMGDVVWSDELNTWTVPVRLDSIGTQYYNAWGKKINHVRAESQPNCIDFDLKWDAESGQWTTLDEKPIQVHFTCATKPAFPDLTKGNLHKYQIKVTDGGKLTSAVYIPVTSCTFCEVYGDREKGFFVDVTIPITDGDYFITTWMKQKKVEGYVYNWDKTPETVTFTLTYTGALDSTLYGNALKYWKYNGKTNGVVATLTVGKQATVTYTDGKDGQLFEDQTYNVICGAKTPVFNCESEYPGYVFNGWKPSIAETVTGDVTYVAQWKNKAANTLYYDANGGIGGPSNNFSNGDYLTVAKNVPTREGYTFVNWNTKPDGTGDAYNPGDKFYVKVPHNGEKYYLYAQWKLDEYTVSFNTNGGVAVEDMKVTFGQKYGKLPTASVNGLSSRKNDWYLVDEDGNVTDTNIRNTTVVTVAKDHTLFLKRDILDPNVKITTSAPGPQFNHIGQPITFTATVSNANDEILNYTYQWYKDDVKLENGELYEGVDKAVLTLKEDHVTASGTYKVVVTATLKDGTQIVTNNESATGEATTKLTIRKTANTLRLDGNGGADDKGNTTRDSYTNGSTTKAPANAFTKAGYTFVSWNTEPTGTGDSYAPGEEVKLLDSDDGGNVTVLYAQWKGNEYTLSRDSNGGEELEDVKVTFGEPYGDALSESHRDGYTFDGWYLSSDDPLGEVVTLTPESVVEIQGDHSVFVGRLIAPIELKITIDSENDTFDGLTRTLTAQHQEFDGLSYTYQWSKDGKDIEGATSKTLVLDGNIADSGTYAVTVVATNNEDSGVITDNDNSTATAQLDVQIKKAMNVLTLVLQIENADDLVTETLDPSVKLPELTRSGYDFQGWNTMSDGTGTAYKASDVLEFGDDGNGGVKITLYAQWKAHTHTVTFQLKDDPTLTEKIALSFTTKTVTFGQKVGAFPEAKRDGYTLAWYDEKGQVVNADTIYSVDGDSTYTGVWVTVATNVVPTGDSSNIGVFVFIMLASLACLGAGVVLYRRKHV